LDHRLRIRESEANRDVALLRRDRAIENNLWPASNVHKDTRESARKDLAASQFKEPWLQFLLALFPVPWSAGLRPRQAPLKKSRSERGDTPHRCRQFK
jgi:hypothetical protein